LLGHSHFNTTAKYLHISMRRLHQLPHLLEGLRVTPVHPADVASPESGGGIRCGPGSTSRGRAGSAT